MSEAEAPSWLKSLVADFGVTTKSKLAGPGDREAAFRAPLEQLLMEVGKHHGLHVVPHDEVRDVERGVRPDYGIRVQGAIAARSLVAARPRRERGTKPSHRRG